MKKKLLGGILFILLLFIIPINFAIAGNIEHNYFVEAATGAGLTGVEMEIYTCTDTNEQCVTVEQPPWFKQNSGANDYIRDVEYPGTQTPTDYAEYFFAECYAPKKAIVPNDWGTGLEFTYYDHFNKIEDCHSPIEDFSIINTAYANEPVQINIDARLDAETYSAFRGVDSPPYFLPTGEEYTDHYAAETEVLLTIYDSNGEVVFEDTRNLNLLFDTSQRVEFIWTPTDSNVGQGFRASIRTDVTDCQCSNSLPDSSEIIFQVLPGRPTNECYTLLNNLQTDNQFPIAGDELTASYTKISNHADNDHVLTAVPMLAEYEVRKGFNNPSGALVFSDTAIIPATYVKAASLQSFAFTPLDKGYHTIYVSGVCSSALCDGLDNPESELSMVIYVEGPELFDITFRVVDRDSMTPIQGASVVIDAVSRQTDSQGMAVLPDYESDTYTYTISHPDYYPRSDIVVVDADTQVDVQLTRRNIAPVLVLPIPDVTFPEDTTYNLLDLDDYGSDEDHTDTELSWSAIPSTLQNINININPTTHIVTFTPDLNFNSDVGGTRSIRFRVTDPEGAYATSNVITVTVEPENDAPSISGLPDVTTKEDTPVLQAFNVRDYASDIETPVHNLGYSLNVDNNNRCGVTLNSLGFININPELNFFGQCTATVTASDGSLAATDSFIVTIRSKNDLPVFSTLPNVVTNEDVNVQDAFDLDSYAHDVETADAQLIFSIVSQSNPGVGSCLIDGEHRIDCNVVANQFGESTITVRVRDKDAGEALQTFDLIINSVDDPAVWQSLADKNIDEGSADGTMVYAGLKNRCSDVDSTKTFRIESIHNNYEIYFEGADLKIRGLFENYEGDETVTVSCNNVDADFLLTINPINDAPIITSLPITSAMEEVLYQYNVNAVDVDRDLLTYSLIAKPSGMTINPITGLVKWTPTFSQVGEHNVRVRVSDGSLYDEQAYVVTVSINPNINHDPILEDIGDITVLEGDFVSVVPSASDADGDALEFIFSAPLDINGGWQTTLDDAGVYTVTVTVEDGRGGSDSGSFTLTVLENVQECEDGLDNDGDGAIDYPNDFSCSSAQDDDEENPKAQCQDGLDNDGDGLIDYPNDSGCSDNQDNDEFNNLPPTASITSPPDDSEYLQGQEVIFTGVGTDNEGDVVSYVWTSNIDAELSSGMGDFSTFTKTDLSIGEHTIVFTVTDDLGLEGSDQISVTIREAIAPTVSITSPGNGDVFKENDAIIFSGSATDRDGIITNYEWSSNIDGAIDSGRCDDSTCVVSFSREDLSIGRHTITLTVQDDDLIEMSDSIEVNIIELTAPIVSIIEPDDGDNFREGDDVEFIGEASDSDGIVVSYEWTSDVDGVLSNARAFSYDSLSLGLHTITLEAVDDDDLSGFDSIEIEIKPLTAPIAEITNPNDGDTFKFGEDVLFEGYGYDPDGLVTSYQWMSDVDGVLEEGTCNLQRCEFSFTRNDLSLGKHDITLTVVDNDVLRYTDTDTVWVIVDPLLGPEVEIIEPLEGGVFSSNEFIEFRGVATDLDGIVERYEWTSDINGELKSGTGAPVDFFMQLPVGEHLITLIAVDDDDQTGQDFVNIRVIRLLECNDGLDNDGDGAIDYPDDFGCESLEDDSELNDGDTQCSDGLDNDGDGAIDQDDPNCEDRYDDDEFAQCNDSQDNDDDGLVDLDDPGCEDVFDDDESDGTTQCQDGLDNDGDGAIDYPSDFSCSSAQDDDEENPKSQCQDGLDNDGDGLIDYPNDSGCSDNQDNDEFNNLIPAAHLVMDPTSGVEPLTVNIQCSGSGGDAPLRYRVFFGDGESTNFGTSPIDIDHTYDQGSYDVVCVVRDADDDRATDTFTLVVEEEVLPECSDGLDNDGDGAIDYPDDFGCESVFDDNELNDGDTECSDGITNDGDDLIDQDDPGCEDRDDDDENEAPVLAVIGDQEIVEGDLLQFTVSAIDPEGDVLSYSARNLPLGASFNEATRIFTWTPGFTQAGVYNNVVFRVTDGSLSDREIIIITVLEDLQECEDSQDNDGDGHIDMYDWGCETPLDDDESNDGDTQCSDGLDNDGDGVIDQDDPNCEDRYDDDEFAQCNDEIDNDFDGLVDLDDPGCEDVFDDDEFNNLVPTAELILNPNSGREPLTVNIQCSGTGGNQPLTYQLDFGDGSFTRELTRDIIRYHTYNEGEYTIVCYVRDFDGDSATDTFTLVVDERLYECNDGIDNDGDGAIDYPNDFGCESLLDDSELNDGDTECSDGITNDGDDLIDQDDPGCEDRDDDNENEAPVLDSIGNKTVVEGELLEFGVTATDPENDPLDFEADNLPPGSLFDRTRNQFRWTPSYTQAGVYEDVLFVVSDGDFPLDQERITITVLESGNHAPIIVSTPVETARELELYRYDVDAVDPDNDLLTYSLLAGPAGMAITPKTGVIEWTPALNQIGTFFVRVQVTDGQLTDDQEYEVTVLFNPNINHRPIIISEPVTELLEETGDEFNTVYNYDVEAIDPDVGDVLTYSLLAGPAGMTIDPATGLITWTPDRRQIGGNLVRVQVSDGNLTDEQEFYITVGLPGPIANPRRALFIDSIEFVDKDPFEIEPGDSVQLAVTFRNLDTYDLRQVKMIASVNDLDSRAATGRFKIPKRKETTKLVTLDIPEYAKPGIYDLNIYVKDVRLARSVYREIRIV